LLRLLADLLVEVRIVARASMQRLNIFVSMDRSKNRAAIRNAPIRSPIEHRKRMLAKLMRRPHAGIVLNEVFEGDGDILFEHACRLGCEGVVSKRLGSLYRSGRSPHWLKIKNPKALAVTREAEEDWGR
jgi:ATP dependent DNA ligase domain